MRALAVPAAMLLLLAVAACDDSDTDNRRAGGEGEGEGVSEGEGEGASEGEGEGASEGEGEGVGEGEGEGEGGPPDDAECLEDRNCGLNRFCHPTEYKCYDQGESCAACSHDRECARGVCLDFASGGRACAQECLSDVGCPRCFRCSAQLGDKKYCAPRSDTCDQACGCEADDDCEAGRYCDDAVGGCVQGCTEDGECPVDRVCARSRCVHPCGGDGDCEVGECDDEGHCRVPGGCVSSQECVNPGTYCDQEQRRCVDGCQRDVDCGIASQLCEDGGCVEKGCDAHYQCGFGQVCREADCVEAEGPYCDQCDPDVEGSCGDPAIRCVKFADEEGNEIGAFCLVPCDDADAGGVCPQGYQCSEVEFEEGQPERVCWRQCHRTPVGMQ